MSKRKKPPIAIACLAAMLLATAGVVVFHHRQPSVVDNLAAIGRTDTVRLPATRTEDLPRGSAAKRLADVLDKTQPQLNTVISIARRDGLDAAFLKIRELHRQTPELPVLPHGLSRTAPDKIVIAADDVMRGGWKFGNREPYPVQTPIDWAADPYEDRGWRMWLNAWRILEPVLAAYDETKDRRYLIFANRIALDWIDQHVFDDKNNPFAWYDMAIGRRALLLGKLIDANLRSHALPDERILDLMFAAQLHAAELHNTEKIVWHSNHGIYQLVGLLSLAMSAPELNGAREFKQFAKQGLRKLLSQDFTAEGIHREHSPFYHVALINTLGLLVERGLIDDEKLLDLFHKSSRNIAWLCHPNGYLVRNGDGDQTLASDRIMYTDDPQLQYVISEGRAGQPPAENYQIFQESGYAVFRSPWEYRPWEEASYLFFSAAFHSRTHKHADEFTFEWSELGRNLLIDGGRYTYQYDHPARKYIESTRAHNTVEIDGRDYSRQSADAFGSAIVGGGESAGTFYVEAELYRKRHFDTHHRRLLVFRPGQWLAVIDHLTSPTEHDFAQCFHFDPDLQFQTASGGGIAARLPNSDTALNVLSLAPQGSVATRLIRGQTEPQLQGWTSLAANELTPNYAYELHTHGSDVLYITLLALTDGPTTLQPGQTTCDDDLRSIHVRWQSEAGDEGFDFLDSPTGKTIHVLSRPDATAEKPGKRIR